MQAQNEVADGCKRPQYNRREQPMRLDEWDKLASNFKVAKSFQRRCSKKTRICSRDKAATMV